MLETNLDAKFDGSVTEWADSLTTSIKVHAIFYFFFTRIDSMY